eukprot:4183235-Prymnesium_polylepis.1
MARMRIHGVYMACNLLCARREVPCADVVFASGRGRDRAAGVAPSRTSDSLIWYPLPHMAGVAPSRTSDSGTSPHQTSWRHSPTAAACARAGRRGCRDKLSAGGSASAAPTTLRGSRRCCARAACLRG